MFALMHIGKICAAIPETLIKSSMEGRRKGGRKRRRRGKHHEAIHATQSRWVMHLGMPHFMETTGKLPAKIVVGRRGLRVFCPLQKKKGLANFIVER